MTTFSKRGDTLSLDFELENADGSPVDLTGWTAAAKMRLALNGLANRPSSPVVDLTATITNAAEGRVTLSATPAQTATWAAGKWVGDIQFTSGGEVQSSRTFTHRLDEDVTY
jgi:hypothetical protein